MMNRHAGIDARPQGEGTICSHLLARIAERLRDASHGCDYGELDAEGAFTAAIWAVSEAIEEAIRECG